ncbi:MAG: cyclase family protein, partial [Proteobacteria bacterium]|nr:cyclase family protein [Pseudomonadota bacterium]
LIVLLRTGFGKYWPDRLKYLGTDERGPEAVPKLHFPGLHPDAAKWIVDNRTVKVIGLDTFSAPFAGDADLVAPLERRRPVVAGPGLDIAEAQREIGAQATGARRRPPDQAAVAVDRLVVQQKRMGAVDREQQQAARETGVAPRAQRRAAEETARLVPGDGETEAVQYCPLSIDHGVSSGNFRVTARHSTQRHSPST